MTVIHGMNRAGATHGGKSQALNVSSNAASNESIHPDLTTSNILFRVSELVLGWSDSEVYAHLGLPETEEVRTRGGEPCGPHAPAELVAPIDNSNFAYSSLLQVSVFLIDFGGQSYVITNPSDDYQSGSAQLPVTRGTLRGAGRRQSRRMGAGMHELRDSYRSPLFEPFLGSDTNLLRQTVETR